MDGLWDDIGPISQGKILTAMMQDRESEAREMMCGWTGKDLDHLARAADRLAQLARYMRSMRTAPGRNG